MQHRVDSDAFLANHELPDPGTGKAIPLTRNGTFAIVTGASGETNTLAAPDRAGQIIAFAMKTDGGGDRVITVASAINAAANTIITLNDIGDYVLLQSKPYSTGYRWQVVVNDGATLS